MTSAPRRGDAVALRRTGVPFLVAGIVSIIIGGVVAAVTSPLSLEHGSWAAAFLVLVSGVALAALGVAQSALVADVGTGRIGAELATWLVGSLAVLGGTLLSSPLIVDVGGILLLISAVIFIATVRRSPGSSTAAVWTFRIVLLIIVVSIPIGLIMSHLRHG
ncbi:hypothetical protein ACSAGD_10475 [Paramicrobacterium sp. CJ85]|uniref:hypothetical protein n=1 Tax=Paramicrobacterium sp. CJ85 TaxID=3445355 RepID=UPI003F5E899D